MSKIFNGAGVSEANECLACDGSGSVVRDPDIGTDQECFACDGSGIDEDARAALQSTPAAQPSAPQVLQEVPTTFTEWLCAQMPAGTVISDPNWWAPRIVAALSRVPAEQPSAPSLSDIAGLTQPYRGEPVYGPASFVKASKQPAPPQQDAQAIETSYELWHDDMCVASASGTDARREINHYAAQYSQDGPVEIFKVTRQLISQPTPDKEQPE